MYIYKYDSKKQKGYKMTKNNLKVVKTDNKKQQELKEKNKSLEAAISQIDQNFGKGSVMRLGQQQALDVEAISTGSLSLDLALGIGGLPKGRIIEISNLVLKKGEKTPFWPYLSFRECTFSQNWSKRLQRPGI